MILLSQHSPPIRFWPVLAFLALLAGATLAGATGAATPAQSAPIIVGKDVNRVEIGLNKGLLIRLERPASAVFIANPEIADIQVKSPRILYLHGKSLGETTVFAADAEDRVLLARSVSVVFDADVVKRAIDSLLPGANIKVHGLPGTLVLSGTVNSASEARDLTLLIDRYLTDPKQVVNRVTIAQPVQVNLRVRISEVNREITKRLGFNWISAFSLGTDALLGIATGHQTLTSAGEFIVRTDDTFSLFGSMRNEIPLLDVTQNLNVVLDALDQEGLITTLAEPNLTAVSGEQATFLAGGEFPILVPQGNDLVTIEFKKFGVSLGFTPTILDTNRISLRVRPEVSELSSLGEVELDTYTVPSLSVRRAETTIELASGQSFAIAGLLKNTLIHQAADLPGLAQLPVLGPLFRSDSFQRSETELMIVVTPYLVRPTGPDTKLALPTDGLEPADDFSRITTGDMHHASIVPERHAAWTEMGGPVGFLID